MRHQDIHTNYNGILHSYGLPHYLYNKSEFSIKSKLKSYQVNENLIISVEKQRRYFDIMCKDESGWLAFVVSDNILEYCKHIAANIMNNYYTDGKRSMWLSSIDNFDKSLLKEAKLVVIDALFFDSSPYRRDKIYEIINYNCNFPEISVIVIGQHNDPIAMSKQLGMKPNFGLMVR